MLGRRLTARRTFQEGLRPFELRVLLIAVISAPNLAAPALAHHRQTPEVVALTVSGDTPLTRQAAQARSTVVLASPAPGGRQVERVSPWRHGLDKQQISVGLPGDHDNPTVSLAGGAVAFDGSDPLLLYPGHQVTGATGKILYSASQDPSGTSANPSIDGKGARIAFESTGNLSGQNQTGARQIFVRDGDGSVRQLSRGLGASRNPVLSARHGLVTFESSSNPVSGAETGIAQIWFGDVETGPIEPITAGAGPSTNPSTSNDARLVVFESQADLAGMQANTATPQVYLYDRKSATYAQITQDPQGCHLPSAYKVERDWRIAYVCGGKPYFTMLRANQRFEVQANGGTTQRVLAGLGIHFVLLSTRADLVSGMGSTPGNQVYLVNLYKRPPIPAPGASVTWFPTQGIPPL